MAGKVYEYIIVLKKRSFVFINRVSLLMITIAALLLSVQVILHGYQNTLIYITIILLMVAWTAFTMLKNKKGRPSLYRISLLLGAWGIFIQPYLSWLAFVYVAAAVFEKQVKFPEEIAFDNDEVIINSFPKKRYTWDAFQNIVLKDGLLTLDYKNNTLFQKQIESSVEKELEDAFNLFCQERLNK
ncbi:MAG: hypothetical protein RJA92_1275 [Bacteroidota bacterium]|jgi:hypothetical protein